MENLSWDGLEKQVESIIDQLDMMDYDVTRIVAICRGGAVLGTILAYRLHANIDYVYYQTRSGSRKEYSRLKGILSMKHQNILIVDDIIDSGHTVKAINKISKILNTECLNGTRVYFGIGCAKKDYLANIDDAICIVGEVFDKDYHWIKFPFESSDLFD